MNPPISAFRSRRITDQPAQLRFGYPPSSSATRRTRLIRKPNWNRAGHVFRGDVDHDDHADSAFLAAEHDGESKGTYKKVCRSKHRFIILRLERWRDHKPCRSAACVLLIGGQRGALKPARRACRQPKVRGIADRDAIAIRGVNASRTST